MDIIIDTIKDTYFIFPILLITYFLLETLEHKNITIPKHFSKYSPLLGAAIGIIPQCGFSVLASLLFIERKISLGTLISVFIATSDEAIPLLIAYPQEYQTLFTLLIFKLIIAIFVGYSIDFVFQNQHLSTNILHSTHNHSHSILQESLFRALKIYTFLFITNIVLTMLIEMIGTNRLSSLLLSQSLIQPIISALFGFIPNCASSVILTQLYIHDILSFASLLAGLITNAGLGLIVLIEHRINQKTFIKICLILFISALIISMPIQWFFLY